MTNLAAWLDRLTTSRMLGIPIFIFVMYCMFFFSVCVGGAFQPFFNLTSQVLFIDLPNLLFSLVAIPAWLQCIIVHGVGRGLNVTLTFIPVLMSMFFFLAVLENSGYIARASFVVSNFMNSLGLPAKSFIPMIIGFGCNVPAVASTKILPSKQERILTTMMVPFVSCGSKLAIYTMFVAAFFQSSGQNIVFLLYLCGVLIALFTGLMLKTSVFNKEKFIYTEKLPAYTYPNLSVIYKSTMFQLKNFIYKAGAIIIPLCIVIGALGNFTINSQQDTVLEYLGKKAQPLFRPMGIEQDNWPAVVGLMTGVIAKEIIIGTLTSLYVQEDAASDKKNAVNKTAKIASKQEVAVMQDNMLSSLRLAIYSIPENLSQLKNSFFHPVSMNATTPKLDDQVLGVICDKFTSSAAAFSYLLFILLYCPCVSVVVMIFRELGFKWAAFSVVWTTGLAYVLAVGCFQVFAAATITLAMLWALGLLLLFPACIYLFKLYVATTVVDNRPRTIPTKIC